MFNIVFLYAIVHLAQEADAGCQAGWLEYSDSCYLIVPEQRQWRDARRYCESLHGHLAIVMSHEENDFLKNTLRSLHPDPLGQFWLDGNDLDTEGEWVWEHTGEVFEITDWYPGEPNQSLGEEDCLTYFVHWDMKWNDEHCDRYLWSICEREKPIAPIG